MNVYRDTNTSITFTHPVGVPLTATVKRGATTTSTDTPITPDGNGTYTLPLTYIDTQYDGPLTITWAGSDGNGNPFSRTQTIQVVTPLVSVGQLRTIFSQTPPPDGDLVELENTVRAVIQTHCAQSFGWSSGPQTYIGNGSGKLILKQRAANLIGILGGAFMAPADLTVTTYDNLGNATTTTPNTNGELNLQYASLIEDGWSLLINWPTFLTVKQAPPEELVEFAPSQDGTIRVPRRYYSSLDRGTTYTLTGEWGYEAVPDTVQEAALILANDYVTNDSQYRDRYLEILKIQQDSWTYHPGAFRGTGNARADLLLGPYRRQTGMVII